MTLREYHQNHETASGGQIRASIADFARALSDEPWLICHWQQVLIARVYERLRARCMSASKKKTYSLGSHSDQPPCAEAFTTSEFADCRMSQIGMVSI